MVIGIKNFSLAIDEYTVVTGLMDFSVDVYDLVNDINTSNSKFILNGVDLATSFSGTTTSGYYIATSDPVAITENIELSMHVENSISGTLDKDYTFMYGYHLEYNDEVDWGAKKEVVIEAEAINTVICPHLERIATYFVTKDYDYVNLGGEIYPRGWKDLSSTIRPQSKYLEYGKTYTITVSGIKDYSSNELPPFSWEFTVEDSPYT